MKGKSKEPIGMILGFIGANGTEIDPLRMKLQRKTYPGAHCLKQFSRSSQELGMWPLEEPARHVSFCI